MEKSTGGDRLWAYTLLASITIDRKMAEVRILFMPECRTCRPGEIANEVVLIFEDQLYENAKL